LTAPASRVRACFSSAISASMRVRMSFTLMRTRVLCRGRVV
jgi:hypothetical protein